MIKNVKQSKTQTPKYKNLQVGDNDLIGNKFNGHDLHINLRKRNIESNHLVWNKESDDKNTYLIAGEKNDRAHIRQFNEYIQRTYDLNSVHNPLMYDIIYNKLFLDADVVHLHLLHNGLWDLNLLPTMSKLKPIVWTVHDMWIVTGDPRADKRPDYYFPLQGIKNIDFNWELRKKAIEASNVTFVVISKYMLDAMREYPLFSSKEIVYIPIGLDFNMFMPMDTQKTREDLKIEKEKKTILVRGDGGARKGLHYIEYALDKLSRKYDIQLLIVGDNELVVPKEIKSISYGWVKDDKLMAKLYNAADLFLMPSTRENFGMMAIEAMACGTIPIVLDGTALPDTVNAPTCGVSTRQDKNVYCDAVERYLISDKERAERAKECVKYVRNKHSMEKYLDSLEEVYENAIKNHEKDKISKNLLTQLKKNNEIVPSLQATNPNYINSVDALGTANNENANLRNQVGNLNNENANLKIEKESLKDQKHEIMERSKIASAKLGSIINSNSWKVTKPIRDLATIIRRIRERVKHERI